MNSSLLSERERDGFRGPVKTVVDEHSTTVFDRNGKKVEWSGNTPHGRVERTYVYDNNERLIRVRGSGGDHEDEFHYDGQVRTQIRHIPPRPDIGTRAFGISFWFDAVSEGEALTDGGTLETTFNERDEPVEKKLFNDEGTLLFRVVCIRDENGRLSEEKLIRENPDIPKTVRDQIPIDQRAFMLAEMRKKFEEMAQQTGLFGNAERAYAYNERGQVAERHMRQGSIREDLMFSYNERGDICELQILTSGFPHEASGETESLLKLRRTYEYDSFGNWTSMTETSELRGNTATHKRMRQLTYHQ
jgi:hypothetical protein